MAALESARRELLYSLDNNLPQVAALLAAKAQDGAAARLSLMPLRLEGGRAWSTHVESRSWAAHVLGHAPIFYPGHGLLIM